MYNNILYVTIYNYIYIQFIVIVFHRKYIFIWSLSQLYVIILIILNTFK